MDKIVVLLVGPQGSGKTTYCQKHLPGCLRISQDEQGRQGHLTDFEEALQRGEPCIVVDRINALKYQRKRYLDLAKQHGYTTRIVWLNADRNLCIRRCKERTDHPTLKPEDADKAVQLFFRLFQIPSRCEADSLTIVGPPPQYVPVTDISGELGTRRHLILGDVHGCFEEMLELLEQLHFDPAHDVLISVGDLVDRGPKIKETVEYLFALPEFHMVLGNHEHKLLRHLQGRSVKVASGLQTTIDAYNNQFPPDLLERLAALPLILKTPSGYVVHAGFDPEMPPEEQSQADCLYMRYYGGKTYFDEINGRVWYALWPKEWPRVFFGHIPEPKGPSEGNVISLDGGCVFGGVLKAFDSRDGQVHAVNAGRAYAISAMARTTPMPPAEALHKREEYVVAGLLRSDRSDDGQQVIYTYADQCVYESAWDEITRHSRGHIFDVNTGECVAWPFPKFFNLGENQESLPENFPWDQPYEMYEKMDGWLGVLYRQEGRFKVASRGSFHSTGAVWATEFVQGLDFSGLPVEATLCFEMIHPEHRIILNYEGQQTLIVLAAFNRFTHEEYPRAQVEEWARAIGLPVVPLLARLSLEELHQTQKDRQHFEGFVIRFADGRRVKVKTDWYQQIAKIMANLTPIAVWEVLVAGKVQEAYLVQVPEEVRPLAEKYKSILEGQYARVALVIERTAGPILEQYGSDRKALANYLSAHSKEVGHCRPAIFLILDGKRSKLDQLIKKLIYPSANQFVSDAELFGR
jgi:RNA ligase